MSLLCDDDGKHRYNAAIEGLYEGKRCYLLRPKLLHLLSFGAISPLDSKLYREERKEREGGRRKGGDIYTFSYPLSAPLFLPSPCSDLDITFRIGKLVKLFGIARYL